MGISKLTFSDFLDRISETQNRPFRLVAMAFVHKLSVLLLGFAMQPRRSDSAAGFWNHIGITTTQWNDLLIALGALLICIAVMRTTTYGKTSGLPTRQKFVSSIVKTIDQTTGPEECIICKDFCERPTQLPCGHIYCYACINAWFDTNQNRCPLDFKLLFVPETSLFRVFAVFGVSASLVGLWMVVCWVFVPLLLGTTRKADWTILLYLGFGFV